MDPLQQALLSQVMKCQHLLFCRSLHWTFSSLPKISVSNSEHMDLRSFWGMFWRTFWNPAHLILIEDTSNLDWMLSFFETSIIHLIVLKPSAPTFNF